jgi:hypothetical protein
VKELCVTKLCDNVVDGGQSGAEQKNKVQELWTETAPQGSLPESLPAQQATQNKVVRLRGDSSMLRTFRRDIWLNRANFTYVR